MFICLFWRRTTVIAAAGCMFIAQRENGLEGILATTTNTPHTRAQCQLLYYFVAVCIKHSMLRVLATTTDLREAWWVGG